MSNDVPLSNNIEIKVRYIYVSSPNMLAVLVESVLLLYNEKHLLFIILK